jgi:hypothetical protein
MARSHPMTQLRACSMSEVFAARMTLKRARHSSLRGRKIFTDHDIMVVVYDNIEKQSGVLAQSH